MNTCAVSQEGSDTRAELNTAVVTLTKQRLPFPEDILHLILSETLVDMNKQHMLELRHTISMVCKTWHDVAIRYLYRDIVLDRAHQPHPLIRTLKHTQTDSISYNTLPSITRT